MDAHTQSPLAVPPAVKKHKIVSVWTDPTIIATATAACIVVHLVLRYLIGTPKWAWQAPLMAVLVAGGMPFVVPLARKLLAREFGSDHLAGISIITSVILDEYLVGSIVILMLSGGTALEQFASRRASSVLDALARRMP